MAKAAILAALYAFASVALNVLAGTAAGLGVLSVRHHAWLAIPTNVLALLAWTIVGFYFAGAAAWVGEAVGRDRLDPSLHDEAKHIVAEVLPWVSAAVLVLIAAYVLGGGADTGAVAPIVHLALALAAVAVHAIAVYRAIVFVGIMLDLQARTESAS